MSNPQLPTVAPDIARDVGVFVHTLLKAVRTRQMYSPAHPTSATADERCRVALGRLVTHQELALSVTPDALFVNGNPMPRHIHVRDCCAFLNSLDIVCLRLHAEPSAGGLDRLLVLLTMGGDTLRDRGGPGRVWDTGGQSWLTIEQVDYDTVLASIPDDTVSDRRAIPSGGSRATDTASTVARDRLWTDLVRVVTEGRGTLEPLAEQRLYHMAHSADAIREFTGEVVRQQRGATAPATLAAQSAAVLMTFDRLARLAKPDAPSDSAAILENIAAAAAVMDPVLLMRAFSDAAESGLGLDLVASIGARFDDQQTARLLATALASEGQASGRMAAAFTALVPDGVRRDRVLRLVHAPSFTDGPFEAPAAPTLVHALEQILSGPTDSAYVSRRYGQSLEQAEVRSHQLRLDAPLRFDEWAHSVSPEAVRELSTTLLLDLFAVEQEPSALDETAQDLAALADDLLLERDTAEAERVVSQLASVADGKDGPRIVAAKRGIATVARSAVVAEVASSIVDLGEPQFEAFERVCLRLGPPVLDALLQAETAVSDEGTRLRLDHIFMAYGDAAVSSLAQSLSNPKPDMARAAIRLLGRLGGAAAMAALQMAGQDESPDRVRAAVHALAQIDTPEARGVLASLLRSGSTRGRQTVVEALAGSRHAGASRLLSGALMDIDPLGSDYPIALRLIAALRLVGDHEAVPPLCRVLRIWSWMSVRRALHITRVAVSVLASLPAPEAQMALADAAQSGGFFVRRHVRAARQAGG